MLDLIRSLRFLWYHRERVISVLLNAERQMVAMTTTDPDNLKELHFRDEELYHAMYAVATSILPERNRRRRGVDV